jgi:multidrug efflux pump
MSASSRRRQDDSEDPAVESLSSFIGIDGTNTTLNSGRIQINLKPLEERKISASDVIRRLQPKPGGVCRHHAVHAAGAGSDRGRPREPHAVPVHAGRSQRRRTEQYAPKMLAKLQQLPATARRGQRSADAGSAAPTLVFDRDTASRLGITPPPSIRRSTTPTASARYRPCLRSSTSITWCWK